MSSSLPKIFCIYCRELGRKEAAEQHFKACWLDVVFVEGIHGKTFKIQSSEPCTIDREKDKNGKEWVISKGHQGLLLSWYMVLTHIWHLGLEEAIVLEDDAFFHPQFKQQYADARKDFPANAQLVYLGWLQRHQRPLKQVNGCVYRMTEGCPFGTHAIWLHRTAVRTLLDTQRNGALHIDVSIWKRSLPLLDWYVLNPSLVTQRSQNQKPGKPDIWKCSL